ncbi:glycosyltransferase [Planctomycetota bacterium]
MSARTFYFAGGGTGGHIYPAIAVAEQLAELEPEVRIHFFISNRKIDSQILSKTNFKYTILQAEGFKLNTKVLIRFVSLFFKSCKLAKEIISASENPVVLGVGGFVAAPVCRVGFKLKVPVSLLNVDIVPGHANKLAARWANEVFVQFRQTAEYFAKKGIRAKVVGCPLRSSFANPQPEKAKKELGLDENKKILLITGASSGSQNINEAACSLLDRLENFADDWQIVHLTGTGNFEKVKSKYVDAKISAKVLDYFDDMADLLAAADLVIGRSGAVSVAEYAAAGVPSICMPYPYHRDRHQYLNAGKLVEAEAAIIVDDLPDEKERADWLWEELEQLLRSDAQRRQMKENCKALAKLDAASTIAERLLQGI